MSSRKVIVFGPTGAVGSAAALTAAELGAKVALAMRDTTKAIPGLDAEKEKQGGFVRVTADLTQPDTVRDAVTSTGAKYAFIYCAHGSSDHMKATIEALKSAGIESVVFLSSFTIHSDLKAVPQSEVIPWIHAQVEINLTDIFGPAGFVAVRPGSFASNSLQFLKGIQEGEVKIFAPDAVVDCIVPEDIGRVSGTVLAKGPQDGNRAIYLYGPELITQMDSVKILAKALGKNPKLSTANAEEAYKMFTEERKMPDPLAKYMIGRAGVSSSATENQVFGYSVSKEELSHVEKYSGKKGTTFVEWVEKNKKNFAS